MNVVDIARGVVECEVTLVFWYEHKQGESRFLGTCLPFDNMFTR